MTANKFSVRIFPSQSGSLPIKNSSFRLKLVLSAAVLIASLLAIPFFTAANPAARSVTANAELTKVLRQSAGMTASDLSFEFEIERYSFDGDTARAGELPQLGSSEVDGRGRATISMSGASVTLAGGMVSLSSSVDILAGVQFTEPGVYVWHISEIEGSSNASSPSRVTYSQASYELRVNVSLVQGELVTETYFVALADDSGNYIDPSSGYSLVTFGNPPGIGRPNNAATPSNLPARVGSDLWVATAVGAGGSYAINARGELFAWGALGTTPQMGQGTNGLPGHMAAPTRVGTASDWVTVSARMNYVAAINEAGELFHWGNAYFEVEDFLFTPTRLGTASNWVDVFVGNAGLFAINDQGQLYTLGFAFDGLLGLGDSTFFVNTLTRVGNRSDWRELSVGANHALGITEDGSLWAWGRNIDGQLGLGAAAGADNQWTPQRVGTASDWVTVRSTTNASAAINAQGQLFTWGNEGSGQLGRPGPSGGGLPTAEPGRVGNASNWSALMGGNAQFLVFNDNNELWGFGSNGSGQLGLGDNFSRSEPTFILHSSGFSNAARGGGSTALLLIHERLEEARFVNYHEVVNPVSISAELTKTLRDESAQASTDLSFDFEILNYSFNGNTADAYRLPFVGTPVPGSNAGRITLDMNHASTTREVEADVALFTRTINILEGISFDSAGVYVWHISEVEGSSNANLPSYVEYSQAVYELRVEVEQLGGFGAPLTIFALVTPLAQDSGAGGSSGFALYSWGQNNMGQLGRPGSATVAPYSTIPYRVDAADNWIATATATGGSYAINSNGDLYAWGAAWDTNQMGQAGINPNPGTPAGVALAQPTLVPHDSSFVYVSARASYVMAISTQGHLYAWGTAPGGANPHYPSFNTPTRQGTANNWIDVSVGTNNLYALNDQGQLWRFAQHGSSFELFEGTRDWKFVSAGSNFAAAITESGDLYTWGAAGAHLGRPTVGADWTPGRVGATSNWMDVRASNGSIAALTSTGYIYTWGATASNQLGRPTNIVPNTEPGRIAGTDFNRIMGGASHYLASTYGGRLYAWGMNLNGQLGLGHTTTLPAGNAPSFVVETNGFAGSSVGGGSHNLMLFISTPSAMTFTNVHSIVEAASASASLTKSLRQVAELTSSGLSFDFEIVRHSFNGDVARAHEIPQLGSSVVDGTGRVTVAMDGPGTTVETADGVSTLSRSVDLLEGIAFSQPGVYTWRVSELVGSSNTSLPSQVIYSQALYELIVEVSQVSPGAPLTASVVMRGLVPDTAREEGGFYIYSWGANGGSNIGRPVTAAAPFTIPGRMGTANNWVVTATSSGGSFAVNSLGELYAWGVGRNMPQMGQGPGAPAGTLTTPTRVGTESNWIQVSARNNNVIALNDQGEVFTWGTVTHMPTRNEPTRAGDRSNWTQVFAGNHSYLAINSQGELYVWGGNSNGVLGLDHSPTYVLEPVRLGDRSDWLTASKGGTFALAVTASGELYSWGSTASGQLGRTATVQNPAHIPGRVGTASNWVEARTTNGAAAALTSEGHLYTWGTAAQIGRPTSPVPSTVPGRIVGENYLAVMGGNQYFLAYNEGAQLFSWGTGSSGQLGLGDTLNRTTPTFVLESYGFGAASRGGGTQVLMLFTGNVDELLFTNTYTRSSNLSLEKTVLGEFAGLDEGFIFDVEITPSALCPVGTSYVVRVYQGNVFQRTFVLDAHTNHQIALAHGERMDFGNPAIGTSFSITERAHPAYIASLELTVAGSPVVIAPNTQPNQALGTGLRVVGEGVNSAHFTNTSALSPDTGLSVLAQALGIVALTAALVATATVGVRRFVSARKLS